MYFDKFTHLLSKIESLNSRNEITIELANFYGELSEKDIRPIMYLIQGRLVPKFIDVEFNFSDKLAVKALSSKWGEYDLDQKYKELGDIGLLAEFVVNTYVEDKDKKILVTDVYSQLKYFSSISGKGSQELKSNLFLDLVQGLDAISAKYLSRIVVGNLRIGISDKTILDSFSWFLVGDKGLRKLIDKAFGARSDLGELAEIIILNKDNPKIAEILDNINIKPGIPVASKLVEREKDSESVWKRMPNCFVQPKLDGLRGQLHFSKDSSDLKFIEEDTIVEHGLGLDSKDLHLIEIYSRNMESLTNQFPELLYSLENLGVESIILDSEIIGYDNENKSYFSYQETMTRRRKYNIKSFSNTFPVKAMCFDILYLNGKDLTQMPVEDRLEILEGILKDPRDSLEMLETKQMKSDVELEDYFTEKVMAGLEGIITKEVGSNYEPGSRNYKWIKLKANTLTELVDTIDVVVLGYYKGSGIRSNFGFGALLAGIFDPETETYTSIGKVGTGFTEDQMRIIYSDLKKIEIFDKKDNVVVDKSLIPDVWVEPKIIMEIIADEITRSPSHTTARGIVTKVKRDDPSKGLSIRFPRLKIWDRKDKNIPNTVDEIVKMYELRKA